MVHNFHFSHFLQILFYSFSFHFFVIPLRVSLHFRNRTAEFLFAFFFSAIDSHFSHAVHFSPPARSFPARRLTPPSGAYSVSTRLRIHGCSHGHNPSGLHFRSLHRRRPHFTCIRSIHLPAFRLFVHLHTAEPAPPLLGGYCCWGRQNTGRASCVLSCFSGMRAMDILEDPCVIYGFFLHRSLGHRGI